MKIPKIIIKSFAVFASTALIISCLAVPGLSDVVLADGDSGQIQVGSLDNVTGLQWVSGSKATLSWYDVTDANNYLVVVTVYQSDGTTVIGSAETGTSSNQLDIQQEINQVISNLDIETVKVKATVYAQTLQDNKVIAQSSGITTGFWDYSASIKALPTPTNLSLSDDLVLTFEYSGDDISANTDTININIHSDYGDLTTSVQPAASDWENGKCSVYIGYEVLSLCQCYPITGPVDVSCSISLRSYSGNYAYSAWSQYSNTIGFSGILPIRAITLSPDCPIVCLGNSYYIGKTISPLGAYYESIEWSSDNESIVTVDQNGKITGVNVGTANITAKIGSVSATVPVTVYKISSNVNGSQDNAEVIKAAGDIIDDIVNNENPDLTATDIDSKDLSIIKDDIQDAIYAGDDFYTDLNAYEQSFATYNNDWDDIKDAAGDSNAQFVGGYDIEVEMYHEDDDGNETPIGNITELENEIQFTMALPEGMNVQDESVEFVLVRAHTESDGSVVYTPVDYVINDNGTFTASSDKYSDFIWCSIERSGNATLKAADNSAKALPATGEVTSPTVHISSAMIIVACGISGFVVVRKRKEEL